MDRQLISLVSRTARRALPLLCHVTTEARPSGPQFIWSYICGTLYTTGANRITGS